MTEKEFNTTAFGADMKAIINDTEYKILAVDWDEGEIGIELSENGIAKWIPYQLIELEN